MPRSLILPTPGLASTSRYGTTTFGRTTTSRLVVFDLEATCDDGDRLPCDEMEVIEIGAVLMAASGDVTLNQFQSFVKPVRHPMLTPFCTGLTHIQQASVDAAPSFTQTMERFRTWLSMAGDFIVCAWGDYDGRQLRKDCDYHGVAFPIPDPILNLRAAFTERHRLTTRPSLSEALEITGLAFNGSLHRALDDARNTARLLPWIVGQRHIEARNRGA